MVAKHLVCQEIVACKTIEDTTGDPYGPLYDFGLAVDRIAAAAEATRALPFSFILTARTHNLLYAAPSLDKTISRLQAMKKPEPMFFSLLAFLTLQRCAQFVRRCRSLSILWWGSKENHFP